MREHKLYANLEKCIFCAPEIPVLDRYDSVNGIQVDSKKVKAIADWAFSTYMKQLWQLADCLHKYTHNHAATSSHQSSYWRRMYNGNEYQAAFEVVEKACLKLTSSLHTKPFHVVWNASDCAIGDDRERVID